MTASVKFALKNIRHYWKSALGRGVILLFLTFSVILACMFSLTMTSAVSDLLNSQSSTNAFTLSVDESERESIAAFPFVNEVTKRYLTSYAYGTLTIEGIGGVETNCTYMKAPDADSLVPQAFLKEFRLHSEDAFLLSGRMPTNKGEVIIDSRFLTNVLRIGNFSAVLGKMLTVSEEWLGETIYSIESTAIVGVFSGDYLKVSELYYEEEYSYLLFVDDTAHYRNELQVYCDYENMEEALAVFSERYGEDKVDDCRFVTRAFDELLDISSFLRKILALVCGIIGMVYVVVQIVTVMNYLNEKEDFVTAIRAFGLKKRNLVLVFLFEYLFVSMIPFAVSSVLSVIATGAATRFMSLLTGIRFTASVNFLPVVIAFAILLLVTLATLFPAVYLHKPARNE